MMDPNATYEAISELISQVGTADADDVGSLAAAALDLLEHWQALDVWLINGGFLPEAWQRNR